MATLFDDDGILIRFMNSNVQVGHLHWQCSIKWVACSSLPWLEARTVCLPDLYIFLLQLMAATS